VEEKGITPAAAVREMLPSFKDTGVMPNDVISELKGRVGAKTRSAMTPEARGRYFDLKWSKEERSGVRSSIAYYAAVASAAGDTDGGLAQMQLDEAVRAAGGWENIVKTSGEEGGFTRSFNNYYKELTGIGEEQ
jgi:hypothetical protein